MGTEHGFLLQLATLNVILSQFRLLFLLFLFVSFSFASFDLVALVATLTPNAEPHHS